jgi:hypothetical protein
MFTLMKTGRSQNRTDRDSSADWTRRSRDVGVEAYRKLFNDEAQIDRWTNEGGAMAEWEDHWIRDSPGNGSVIKSGV